jgi:hypothetical protein
LGFNVVGNQREGAENVGKFFLCEVIYASYEGVNFCADGLAFFGFRHSVSFVGGLGAENILE